MCRGPQLLELAATAAHIVVETQRQNRTRHTPFDRDGAIVSLCTTLSDHPPVEHQGWRENVAFGAPTQGAAIHRCEPPR